MLKSVFPFISEFPRYLTDYIEQATEAIKKKKHHDYRRHLFVNFLRLGFEIDPVEIEIEKKIKVAEVRGRIDAFFKATIFEFKTDIEKERPAAMIELSKYFESRPNPSDYFALLTDGLFFEVYQYRNAQPIKISEFKLSQKDPVISFRYLDQFIFTSKPIKPDSDDIVQRFGLYSTIFNICLHILQEQFNKIKNESSVKVKFKEWNFLLARVYGTELGDTKLFIKHTYLTMFSRLLVAKTLFPGEIRSTKDYIGLLTGEYFKKKNLPNLVEPDFFSWAIETAGEDNFIGFLSKLEGYFDIYDLSEIKEDVLKELYQELVDPESRHAIGEYYTPDWLAELTLKAIGYQRGRLLDPACGSGTFLFRAIKLKQESGLKGQRLLKDVLSSIIGIDVHPVAVIMAKANIILALKNEIKNCKEGIYIQVYLSDTLIAEDIKKKCLAVPASKSNIFYIPLATIKRDINLSQVINKLSSYAHKSAGGVNPEKAFLGLSKTVMKDFSGQEIFYWRHNFKLMIKLYKQKKNSIWSYILKNAYQPAFLRYNKVDYVAGNPPWLAYRYIKEPTYKARVKELTFELDLMEKKDVKLFTHMDTSTVFYRYCERDFLKPKGIIAFVMPKTTTLPSKQHFAFQNQGVSEIYDFTGVHPLFKVRAVVLINKLKDTKTSNIPITYYEGKLRRKNIELKVAKKDFKSIEKDRFQFLDFEINCPYYYERFFQGATLVPRCFWFIQPTPGAVHNINAPFLETCIDAKKEAKKPWEVFLQGRVEKEFLYDTVLAKGLLPFAIFRKELIFLPIIDSKGIVIMMNSEHLLSEAKEHASQWMQEAEELWKARRSSEERTIYQRIDYNNTLTNQNIKANGVVIYNTSGSNLTAALCFPEKENHGIEINGFVADHKTYYYYPKSIEEGDYLCSILNSQVVNDRIKAYQPEGLFGARDIHRRPFEVCPIPIYDEQDPEHIRLSSLGKECRNKMEKLAKLMKGKIGRIRLEARRILSPQLIKIDELAISILKKQGQDEIPLKPRKKKDTAQALIDF